VLDYRLEPVTERSLESSAATRKRIGGVSAALPRQRANAERSCVVKRLLGHVGRVARGHTIMPRTLCAW
jgi:hypothetical protein